MLVLMTGSLAMAQPGQGRGRLDGQGPENRWDRLADRLELTDDQQSKIEGARLEHLKKMNATRNELSIRNAELEAAIATDKPDRKQIDDLVSAVNRLQNDLFAGRTNHRLAVRELLSADQKVLFDQMHSRMGYRSGRGSKR